MSRGVECRLERHPLGVVASITPFNFPSMVPHWTLPNAIALGNSLILKPSELVPLSAGRIAELLREAGLPDGVFNVVHGGREAVGGDLDHPGIAAVSFVGLDGGREGGLPPRHGGSEAGPRARWREESPDRHAGRRSGDGLGRRARLDDAAVRASAAWRPR